jgi:hypothetical protein
MDRSEFTKHPFYCGMVRWYGQFWSELRKMDYDRNVNNVIFWETRNLKSRQLYHNITFFPKHGEYKEWHMWMDEANNRIEVTDDNENWVNERDDKILKFDTFQRAIAHVMSKHVQSFHKTTRTYSYCSCVAPNIRFSYNDDEEEKIRKWCLGDLY